MMHWAAQYVGKKHEIGGRGPDVFDCWGLLWWIYKHQFHIDVPTLPGVSSGSALSIHREMCKHIRHVDWYLIHQPEDGCAVAMSQSHAYHHVGIYLEADGGKILHCWDNNNVVADTLRQLKLKGLKTIHFYKHSLWPT